MWNVNRQIDRTAALDNFNGDGTYDTVLHIKAVVKQLMGYTDLALKNREAGALKESTVKAMKRICDNVMGPDSKPSERHEDSERTGPKTPSH